MHRLIFVLAVMATAATAQDWALRDSDAALDGAALQTRLIGQAHTFHDGGVSRFDDQGRYSYTYSNGGTAFGTYELRPGGVVCTAFEHGFSRCDMYVATGTGLVLLTEDGLRFPIRETAPI